MEQPGKILSEGRGRVRDLAQTLSNSSVYRCEAITETLQNSLLICHLSEKLSITRPETISSGSPRKSFTSLRQQQTTRDWRSAGHTRKGSVANLFTTTMDDLTFICCIRHSNLLHVFETQG
ncbi:hypothetical protein LOAG_01498 [Loa loa]|uniref:Uncharacterized protein n=1 Tax=Loa loa TaxID=7209 RepID=A0A1I7W0C0_LOALO|nr:hypothetical protein LOAG_01498 [Loa loa]EFO26983.1 hypothetical protein LOAG_01498 [Loa loa]